MPLQFSRFLKKVSVEVVVGRLSYQAKDKFDEEFIEKSVVIYITEDFAKKSGFKGGEIVKVTAKGRSVNMRVQIADVAPENGAFMPNSIYSSYLTDFNNFKRFKATIEPADGDVTRPEEIIRECRGDSEWKERG